MTWESTVGGVVFTADSKAELCLAIYVSFGGSGVDYYQSHDGGKDWSVSNLCVYIKPGVSGEWEAIMAESASPPPSGGASAAGPSADMVAAQLGIFAAFLAAAAVVFGLKFIYRMLVEPV